MRVDHALDFGVHFVAKVLRSKLQARLDQRSVLFDRQARVRFEVAEDPALALRHRLVAEFLHRDFVAPLAKCAFGEFLDIALVHQRDGLAAVLEREADGYAHQPLGSGNGDRLDADAGV